MKKDPELDGNEFRENVSESGAEKDRADDTDQNSNRDDVCLDDETVPDDLADLFPDYPLETAYWFWWIDRVMRLKKMGHKIVMLVGSAAIGKGQYISSVIFHDKLGDYRQLEQYEDLDPRNPPDKLKHICELNSSDLGHVRLYPFEHIKNPNKFYFLDFRGEDTTDKSIKQAWSEITDNIDSELAFKFFLQSLLFSLSDGFCCLHKLDCEDKSRHPFFNTDLNSLTENNESERAAKGTYYVAGDSSQSLKSFLKMMKTTSAIMRIVGKLDIDSKIKIDTYLKSLFESLKSKQESIATYDSWIEMFNIPVFLGITRAEVYKFMTEGSDKELDPAEISADSIFNELDPELYKLFMDAFKYVKIDWLSSAFPGMDTGIDDLSDDDVQRIRDYPYPGVEESFKWLWNMTMEPMPDIRPTKELDRFNLKSLLGILSPFGMEDKSL